MRGIFSRIYLSFLATTVIAVVVTLLLAVFYRQWSNDLINLIAPTGGYISAAELVLQRGGEPLLVEWLLTFDRHPSVNAYVFDEAGVSLVAQAPSNVLEYAFSRDVYQAQINPLSASEVLVKAPIFTHDDKIYLLVVEFVHPLAVFNLPEYLAWGFVAAVLLFAILGWILSSYLTQPLKQLGELMGVFAIEDWKLEMPDKLKQRKDEIGELSREFEHMSKRIRDLMSTQERLLWDVSHELRSPLARMSVANELARLDAPTEQIEFLDRIELENQRLNDMIGLLLQMAKLETKLDDSQWQAVSCDELMQSVVDDACFEHANHIINVTATPDACTKGDARLLRSAFENLVRNALVHTRDDTSVDINLCIEANKTVKITVCDHGTGVPEHMLTQLLEPFVRNESGRERSLESLGKGHQGFGLGLSIAHRVVTYHQGQLVLSNRQEGGLCATITLPLYKN